MQILSVPATPSKSQKTNSRIDDQLAEIYELSEEEGALMTKGLKPWKDTTRVKADM
jgi:hypothetical protein